MPFTAKAVSIVAIALFLLLNGAVMTQAESTETQEKTLETRKVQLQKQQEKAVQATEKREAAKEKVEEKKTQLQEKRAENTEKACEASAQRISLWQSKYVNNQAQLERVTSKLYEVTEKLITRSLSAGKDTTKLEEALAAFKLKVTALKSENNKLVAALESAQGLACGESEGAYKEAVRTIQNQAKVARQASLDMRTHYQQVVRPAARELLQQTVENKE